MRRVVLVLGLVLLAVAALVWAVPFLTDEREYAAVTPQPDPLFTTATIPLAGGEEACVADAVIDPYSEVAHVRASTPGADAMPLELTLRGAGGYAAEARIPATYADHALVAVPVVPPPEAAAATICVRNAGGEAVQLAASDDRTNARRPTTVDGAVVPQNFVLLFSEAESRTIAERLPLSLERASAFRPAAPALLWPLLALFVIGVPLGVLGAFAWASGRDGA
jgi:hypothetical protein